MEVNGRKAIIDKMQSRVVTIDEFNWDHLMAPPLYSLVTQEACNEICRIATSIRYSGNARLRMDKIDNVLKPFGFERKGAGTNRLVYRYLENDTFLLKVAFDAVGVEDNPKEFKNQFIYKPFVTKIFEVDPTGAVALIERVVPITSREEFMTVASEVYDVIRGWFLGDYIMADIGTKFFMNWGIRKNFGPVLLDFPYVYELDGNKLYCNECYEGILCGGEIDYDDGYNMLYCSKCGKRYRVKQLAKATENNQIIVKGRESKMQIVAKMGNKIVKSTESVITNTFKEETQAVVKKHEAPDRSNETGKLEVKATFKPVPQKNNKKDINKDNKQHRNNSNFKNGANNRGIVRSNIVKADPEPVKVETKVEEPKEVPAVTEPVTTDLSLERIVELETKIDELNKLVKESNTINDDLKAQLDSAYADYDKMEEYKDAAEKKAKDLDDLYQHALADLNLKEEELITLKKSVSESETSSSSAMLDLNNQIADLKKQLDDANIIGQKYADDCSELEKKLTAAEAERKDLEKKLAESKHTNADNDSKFANEMNECKIKLDAKNVIDLEAKVATLETSLSETEDAKVSAVKDLEAKLKSAEEKVESFEKNAKGTEDLHKEAIEKLTAEKEKFEKDNKDLQTTLEDKQNTIDSLNKLIDTMTAANEAAREERAEEDKKKVKLPINAKDGVNVMTDEEKADYNSIVRKSDVILPVDGEITTLNSLAIKNNKDFVEKDQYVLILKNGNGGFVKDGNGNFISVVSINNVTIPELFEDDAEMNKTANQVTLAKTI